MRSGFYFGQAVDFLFCNICCRMAVQATKGSAARVLLLYIIVLAACVPIVLLPFAIRKLQATVEFGILVLVPRLWNSFYSWLRPPYLYVVLNMVIVTLGVKSGVLGSSNNGNSCPDNFMIEVCSDGRRADEEFDPGNAAGDYMKPGQGDLNRIEGRTVSAELPGGLITEHGELMLKQILEYGESYKPDPSFCNNSDNHLILLDVCNDSEMQYMLDIVADDDEGEEEEEDEETLSAEELYVKAEVFIGNFYRDLKLQRQY